MLVELQTKGRFANIFVQVYILSSRLLLLDACPEIVPEKFVHTHAKNSYFTHTPRTRTSQTHQELTWS